MKILILGAGKMGSFFIDTLSFEHEVGVFEKNPQRLRYTYNCQRFTELEEIREFAPELVINAATVKYTIPAFQEILPYLPESCILSDISSVKTNLKEYYESTGRRYVSTHPMFGPTFANLNQLSEENAIITFTASSVLTSTNIHLMSTTVLWHTRSVFLSCQHSCLLPL